MSNSTRPYQPSRTGSSRWWERDVVLRMTSFGEDLSEIELRSLREKEGYLAIRFILEIQLQIIPMLPLPPGCIDHLISVLVYCTESRRRPPLKTTEREGKSLEERKSNESDGALLRYGCRFCMVEVYWWVKEKYRYDSSNRFCGDLFISHGLIKKISSYGSLTLNVYFTWICSESLCCSFRILNSTVELLISKIT